MLDFIYPALDFEAWLGSLPLGTQGFDRKMDYHFAKVESAVSFLIPQAVTFNYGRELHQALCTILAAARPQ